MNDSKETAKISKGIDAHELLSVLLIICKVCNFTRMSWLVILIIVYIPFFISLLKLIISLIVIACKSTNKEE